MTRQRSRSDAEIAYLAASAKCRRALLRGAVRSDCESLVAAVARMFREAAAEEGLRPGGGQSVLEHELGFLDDDDAQDQ